MKYFLKERREKIKEYMANNDFVSLVELSEMFPEVSTMTLRRDLEFLEAEGEIIRTKGGAKSIKKLTMMKEDSYNMREFVNPLLKEEIAKKAVSVIDEGGCIYFDAGSTVMQIAKAVGQKEIFAVTSGPNIAMELTKNKNCEINVVCGRLNRDNIALSGLHAVEFIEDINITKAIIAASGFTEEHGFTCGNYDECRLKSAVIKKAQQTVVVMDSTKLNKNHPFTFAMPEDIDVFVTDSGFDKESLKKIKQKNVIIL